MLYLLLYASAGFLLLAAGLSGMIESPYISQQVLVAVLLSSAFVSVIAARVVHLLTDIRDHLK